jgi:high-affinity nickel permease
MTPHPLGLADAITLVLLFLIAVFLLGLLVGLAHMWWRVRQDRLEQEKEDKVATSARSPDPRAGHSTR